MVGVLGLGLAVAGCSDYSFFGSSDSKTFYPPPASGGVSPASQIAYRGAVLEGAVVSVSGEAPGAATIAWGDGVTDTPPVSGAGAYAGAHTFADEGSYPIQVTVAGGSAYAQAYTQTYTQVVTNASPVVSAVDLKIPTPSASGTYDVSLAVAFTDGGSADVHTAQIDWGDGTVEAGVVDPATRVVSGAHSYAADGLHEAVVTVTDDDAAVGRGTQRVFCGGGLFPVRAIYGTKNPARLAWSGGVLYVADRRGGVKAFDAAGARLPSPVPGVSQPLGLAVVAGNPPRIYVGDAADGSVRAFESGAQVLALGAGAGEFTVPGGVAVDSANGRVYVVDTKAVGDLRVYDTTTGALLSSVPPVAPPAKPLISYPYDVAVNPASGDVFVSDAQGSGSFGYRFRLAVFDLSGAWKTSIDPRSALNPQGDPAFAKPAGLCFTGGKLYVTSVGLSYVSVLAPGSVTGTWVYDSQIGFRGGTYWSGELNLPTDVATDGSSIFVSLTKKQVSVFEAAP